VTGSGRVSQLWKQWVESKIPYMCCMFFTTRKVVAAELKVLASTGVLSFIARINAPSTCPTTVPMAPSDCSQWRCLLCWWCTLKQGCHCKTVISSLLQSMCQTKHCCSIWISINFTIALHCFLQFYFLVTRAPKIQESPNFVGWVIQPQPIEHGPRDWLLWYSTGKDRLWNKVLKFPFTRPMLMDHLKNMPILGVGRPPLPNKQITTKLLLTL